MTDDDVKQWDRKSDSYASKTVHKSNEVIRGYGKGDDKRTLDEDVENNRSDGTETNPSSDDSEKSSCSKADDKTD